MMSSTPVSMVVALVVFCACSAREEGGGTVFEDPPRRDAAAPAPDAGARGGDEDAGGGGVDDAGGRYDAGEAVPPPFGCDEPPPAFPSELSPRCAAATATCVRECAEPSCMLACIEADATAPALAGSREVDCGGCIRWQQKVCIDRSGCHEQTAALECCLQASCPDGSCIATTCASQNSAWESCARSTATPCLGAPTTGEFYGVCFPSE